MLGSQANTKDLTFLGIQSVNGHCLKANKGKVVKSMKDNLGKKYLVRHTRGRELTVSAKNGIAAKRQACKFWGYIASNSLIGIKACSAKLIPRAM